VDEEIIPNLHPLDDGGIQWPRRHQTADVPRILDQPSRTASLGRLLAHHVLLEKEADWNDCDPASSLLGCDTKGGWTYLHTFEPLLDGLNQIWPICVRMPRINQHDAPEIGKDHGQERHMLKIKS
jgi:hypothetical protein